MNEHIEKLAKQTLSKDQFGLWLAGDGDIEKFVELLIKECALIAGLMEHEGRSGIGRVLLDRFGVEE